MRYKAEDLRLHIMAMQLQASHLQF